MGTILYLLRGNSCPDFGPDTDAIVVAEEDEASESSSVGDYACLTTLVVNGEDTPAFRKEVVDWWQQRGGEGLTLEVLATDLSTMSRDQRDSIAALEPGSWSVRSIPVLFRRGSSELEAKAREIVLQAALASTKRRFWARILVLLLGALVAAIAIWFSSRQPD